MIRWGIIGAGNIANRFANSLENDPRAMLYAVACRSEEKAKRFQDNHPCEKAYGSYDALLEDENIDVVYIALPHLYHYEWSKKALLKGKAVLCEKPAMMNASEMEEIASIAREQKVFFMEAMKTRFIPMYKEIKQMVKDGVIGEVTRVETSLCSDMPYVENAYHYEPGQGGCILDIGVYNLCYVEDYAKGPVQLEEMSYELYDNGVEIYTNASLKGIDVSATVECAFNRSKPRQAIIQGTKGKIVIDQLHRPQHIEVHLDNRDKQVKDMAYEIDDFYSQISHVHDCLEQGLIESPIMSLESSINIATILDTLRKALR